MIKKLIEVALPLGAINKASVREGYIYRGNPSALHKWWAQRPLAAARAVIFAQMVDDPSSHPDLFPTEKAQEKERKRLFKIIEDLVQWENTTNEEVLQLARDEIWQSWRRTCAENADHPRAKELFDRYKLPAFHDPFAGGGSLPLEAQRLGLEAYASDLNPVAVLINKAMIEIPPKFAGKPPVNPEARKDKPLFSREWKGAQGLAEDVRYYGKWVRDEAEKRIGHFYPKVEVTAEMTKGRSDLKPLLGQKLTAIAWLWARTVKSPNPAFAQVDVPLASTFMLSTKAGKEAYVEPVIENGGYRFTVKVGKPKDAETAKNGTKLARANFKCLMSGTPISGDYIKAEGKAGRLAERLMAIVAKGERGRVYLAPTAEHEASARTARPEWKPEGDVPARLTGGTCVPYGLTSWGDLFTPRQLVALTTFSDLMQEARERVKRDAVAAGLPDDAKHLRDGGREALAYAEAIGVYLAMAEDKTAEYGCTIVPWYSKEDRPKGLFARQAIPMVWDYAEVNPLGDIGGTLFTSVGIVAAALSGCAASGPPSVAIQADAASVGHSDSTVISTDPPYYAQIGYADLSDFFYVWLRRSLRTVYPDLFATLAVPKAEELVATPYRHGGKEAAEAFFLHGMTRALCRLAEQSHPSIPLTVYYASQQAESQEEEGGTSTAWDTFLEAVVRSGLAIGGTWPLHTERAGRSISIETNALASSIVLVCRPRPADAPTATRREFAVALKAELPAALAHLQRGNIAPVDLAQAAIGPGMAVFTRYAKVLDAEGKPLPVREALALINQVLGEALAEQEGDFDADTRWALAWFEQQGFVEGEFGVAEVLSKAKVTSVDGLEEAGIVKKGRGKVRLLRPDELSDDWDPATDSRLTAWEIVHHLIRALEVGGEGAAAELVAKLGSKAEAARELAYRLHKICTDKKRASEALSYNALVQSWPEITRLAREGGESRTGQSALFSADERSPMKLAKKLIEVALPLEAINVASAREKSIRHGHPSTLHLWWARRPLAAARAVIFAQMVDDPSSHPDLFKTEKAQEKERKRLFKIIEDLVQWENTTNEDVLQRARDEIWRSWRLTCTENADHPRAKELFDRYKLPAFHDPFAGGGSLPLEAQRLGLEAYASDLNPVAVLICKAMIEIPPKFAGKPPVNPEARNQKEFSDLPWKGAQGLAEDVRYYGQRMREEAEKRIGHLYPKVEVTAEMAKARPDLKPYVGRKLTVIAWLWARTVKSPNPAFAQVDVPLASTFMLSTKAGKEAYVEPVIANDSYRFAVKMGKPKDAERAKNGTKLARANFSCLMSGSPISGDYIKAEGKAGRMDARLMAIVAEGDRRRVYLAPTPAHEAAARLAKPEWKPDLTISGSTQYLGVKPYGMNRFDQIFTDRQLVALTAFSDLVQEARERVARDARASGMSEEGKPIASGGLGAAAYADALALYLAFALDRVVDRHSSIATWDSSSTKLQLRNTFSRQAIQMTWDFGEGNPLCTSSGTWSPSVEWVAKSISFLPSDAVGHALQACASTQTISLDRIVSTDPPYYDNVPYADLSDFFYVWLRRSLRPVFPDLFATLSVPKTEELVAFAYRHDDKAGAEAFFLNGMTQAMHRLAEQAHPAFPITIYYAFKQAESDVSEGTASTGWETFLDAVIRAGFATSGTWPMRTELGNRMRGMDSNALASSIVLVCRSRVDTAPTATRREFVSALRAELPKALAHLQHGNIAPVDLAQAAIGPGMAVYTRYAKIVDAKGDSLPVREALALINQALDEALAQQEGDVDADTRWALAWFEQSGFDAGEYGLAETLSKAKDTSVGGMVEAGVAASKGGKVRLLKPDELPDDWDPDTDPRLTTWKIVHHLIRALEAGGEPVAAELISKLGSSAETARELAYRLYTICERKKRAAEALSYNGLVQSWPEIIRLAREKPVPTAVSGDLFEE